MNNKIVNCIKCGSNDIALDISLGKLKCNHCGTTIENEIYNDRPDKVIKESEQIISKGAKDIDEEKVNIVILKCSSCGVEFYSAKNDSYPKCNWCGGELSIQQELEKIDNNIEILPFTISKKEALNCIKEKFSEDRFFKRPVPQDVIDKINNDSLIGVYLPYKVIGAKYKCNFEGKGEIKVNLHVSSNDDRPTYTVDSYDIVRNFDIEAKDIFIENKDERIIDKQSAISNIITSSNPYDTNDTKQLEGKYLKNSIAEVITSNQEIDSKELRDKLTNVAKHAILSDILFYDRGVRWDKTELSDIKTEYSYIYLPVWLYLYKKQINNETEYFYVAVNGRTKEVVNHLPYDRKRNIYYALKHALPLLFIEMIAFFWILAASKQYYIGMEWFRNILSLLILLAIPTVVFFCELKINKNYILGDNILNENDNKIKTKINKIQFSNNMEKSYSTGGMEIEGINDNREFIER